MSEIIGYRDHEGYVWDKIDHAKDYFEGRYFSLVPVIELDTPDILEFNLDAKE